MDQAKRMRRWSANAAKFQHLAQTSSERPPTHTFTVVALQTQAPDALFALQEGVEALGSARADPLPFFSLPALNALEASQQPSQEDKETGNNPAHKGGAALPVPLPGPRSSVVRRLKKAVLV
jgi:hypothetical protein